MTNQDLFTIKPLNQWIEEAASRTDPRSLFGDFWLKGELSILFSDAGKGKSLLAAQIAESIASGIPVEPLAMSAQPQKVLYFDLELSSQQFAMRYAADPGPGDEFLKNPYRFSKNFCRAELAASGTLPEEYKTYEAEYVLASIEKAIRASGAKVVIIDSIAWVQGSNAAAAILYP